MKSKRVRLTDIPVWGRFRRLGSYPGFGWCVRVNETRYCEEQDVSRAKEALEKYPTEPGDELFQDVDKLVDMCLNEGHNIHLLMAWNGFYTFQPEDFAKADKKHFLVPAEDKET
jgi:hypothetical protein